MKKGLLIVIDGTDGSGKTTQINLLSKFLKEKRIPFKVISFPRYGQNKYAKAVQDYLEGKFGSIEKVDPYQISTYYAGDRLLAKPEIEKWINEGEMVIANRYVSSNKAHMGANLPPNRRAKFFKWLNNLEYRENSIPKENLTILLMVDPKVGQINVLAKESSDLHEENLSHLEAANKIYLALSQKEKNWIVVNCMKNGRMRTPEDIHLEIVKNLQDMLLSPS